MRRLVSWLLAFTVSTGAVIAEVGPRPNVLVITVDTFRPDHLGAYGYDRHTSPHIDSIAARGVVFSKAYTTSAWTTPGLISLLTSLDAPSHGVDIRGKSIHPNVVTLPDVMREEGYRAPDIFFLTDIPNFHYLGLEPYAKRREYVRQGDEILFRWLQEEADAEAPFFLYYHYRDLHQPYDAGEDFRSLYLEEAFGSKYNPVSWARRFLAFEKMTLVKREVMMPRGIIDFAPWDRSWVNALYDAQIRRMDEEFFGRLRQVLRETGLVDNTLIVISADHGEELLEHGLVGHVSTYKEGRLVEELVRIPLILAGPGIEAGQRIDARVQVIDAMPTILDLVGVPPPETMQGRSLLPLTRGESRTPQPLFFETSAGGYPASIEQYSRRTRAVIAGDWKLVTHIPSGETELFDLAADPLEDEDEFDSRPALADSLKKLLDDWILNSEPLIGDEAIVGINAPAVQGDAPTVIEFPVDGDTLRYLGADQTVRLRWTGETNTSYRVFYEVGEGVYHLKGEMSVDSNMPSYGPFHASFWNSVVLYSPFTVRVHPAGRPDLISAPITFSLAPSGESMLAISPGQILMSISMFGRDMLTLAAGCVLGLVDLSIWLSENLSAADVTAWALLLAIAGALVWPRLLPLGERRVKAWLWFLAYVGLVYSTIAIFPRLWNGLRIHAGDSVRHLGTIAVVLALLYASRQVQKRKCIRNIGSYLGLSACVLAYAFLLHRFGQFPAERLHLLEYGLMSMLLHRAMTTDADVSLVSYVGAWGLTILIGFGDETIQWILPQRYFELKDVGLNALAAALGLAMVYLVRQETA